MVNVLSKRCGKDGCKKQPRYNIEGKTKGLYCFMHKMIGMIDVVSKTCIEDGCKTQPFYNIEGKLTGLYCNIHKKDKMVDVKNKRCIEYGCKIMPNFNIEGETKGLYCATHKKEGMINVIVRTCKTYLCSTQINNKYDGYCLFCYINLFPDKPVSRNYKTKEYSVVEYIKQNLPELHWIADKRIRDGFSKRRPDLLLDLGYQVIIVEIDENQHMKYDCSCENKRIMELSQDVGHRPIVFIRFNPDEYISYSKTNTSCWETNGNGICVVKKSKIREWQERLDALKQQIDYWLHPENKTNKTVEIIQLFYNE